ncbi:HypC/HybG/HupF family hydrogenase formation chaperone [Candidatus Woesearchaeota archaeon]|nr:HypC/HybG/HupF family hydrogenase formation chaperone [Candidatus Woesearchaeota archaeon]
MCLAIPAKILSINGDSASVDYGGVTKKVNVSLVDELEIDDYVLIHAGFAIEKLDKKEALKSLEILQQFANLQQDEQRKN